MGSKALRDTGEAADTSDVPYYQQPTTGLAPGAPAAPVGSMPRAYAQSAPAAQAAPSRSIFSQVGDFLFGGATKPGILGTGQYQVQAPTVNMGAGNLPNVDQTRATLAQNIQDARNAQVGTDFRNAQMGLMGDLQAAANGQGTSVAQQQLQRGLEGNLAASVAASNSIRGPGGGTQAGQLLAARAAAGQQAVSDSAMLRAQEIAQARQQLAGVAQTGRSQDEQDAAQRDELIRSYTAMGMDLDKAQQAAAMDMEKLRVNTGLAVEGMRQGEYGAAATRNAGLLDKVVSGISGALGGPAGAKK